MSELKMDVDVEVVRASPNSRITTPPVAALPDVLLPPAALTEPTTQQHSINVSSPSSMSANRIVLNADDIRRLLLTASSDETSASKLDQLLPAADLAGKSSAVRAYYAHQNDFIGRLKHMLDLTSGVDDADDSLSSQAYFAIKLSLALTFVLLGMKLGAAIYSGSIAIIASAIDSFMDILSQGTLLLTHRMIHQNDPYRYPAGKNRFEPLAVAAFSIIMGLAAIFLLYQSILDLQTGLTGTPKDLDINGITIGIVAAVIVIQFGMFIYCRSVAVLGGSGSSSAEALAQDHINDVVINIIGGVPAILAGYFPTVWWLDPAGGIALSIYICLRWIKTGYEQFPALAGRSADADFLGQLIYLAAVHDERILKIDTVMAYHVGVNYQCEVHIVLPADLPLVTAHDIGETLEQKIEKLDNVEMAFVHLDYEYNHRPEHFRAKIRPPEAHLGEHRLC